MSSTPYTSTYHNPKVLGSGGGSSSAAVSSEEPGNGNAALLSAHDEAAGGGDNHVTAPTNGKFSFEAEHAHKSGAFTVKSDGAASSGAYVEATQNYSGKLQFDIDNAEAGHYTLQARVLAPTHQDNSFFAKVNGGPTQTWHIDPDAGWQGAEFGPSVALHDGDNTVEILAREDGTAIDNLSLIL